MCFSCYRGRFPEEAYAYADRANLGHEIVRAESKARWDRMIDNLDRQISAYGSDVVTAHYVNRDREIQAACGAVGHVWDEDDWDILGLRFCDRCTAIEVRL